MAKLNPEDLIELTAATAAATLTTSRKFIRNYNYYKQQAGQPETIPKSDLLVLCHTMRLDLFGLQNLLEDETKHRSPFVVTLASQINDALEELHRKILFFEPELIESIIPIIDRQRQFWSRYTDEQFYGVQLSSDIEHSVSSDVLRVQSMIQKLPETATL
jgi:hypothetical protein